MKKLLYLTQRYRPPLEATSKEIALLSQTFHGAIFNIHLDGLLRFIWKKDMTSHHLFYYPFTLPLLYCSSNNKIIHIYSNLCDRPYLPFFKTKNTILSSTNFISKEKIIRRRKDITSVKKIIIQSEIQKKELIDAGIPSEKISLIYPPVDLDSFSYQQPSTDFTILCASTPAKVKDLEKRGIYFILNADNLMQNIKIKFLLRNSPLVENIIKQRQLQNIETDNNIYQNMDEQYAKVHATLISYLRLDGYLKLIPTSAAESLAAGKPLIVSSQTGIAEIVEKEKCGVIFEPNQESFLQAINRLKKEYKYYQQNCRKTAEKYFSKNVFIKKHEEIYQGVSGEIN